MTRDTSAYAQGQRLAAAHAALQHQHAAACRQVRVLRKVLACQRAAAAKERAARIDAEIRLVALLGGAADVPAKDLLHEDAIRAGLALTGQAPSIHAGATSTVRLSSEKVPGAARSQMKPRSGSSAGGSVPPRQLTASAGKGPTQAAAPPAREVPLTPAGDGTATPSIPTTVPEATLSDGRPVDRTSLAAPAAAEDSSEKVVHVAAKRRRSGPTDSRHADMAPTPRCGEASAVSTHMYTVRLFIAVFWLLCSVAYTLPRSSGCQLR